jgi:ubiquitin-protein ligase
MLRVQEQSQRGNYQQRLRDYAILMEYKLLKASVPTGCYVAPSKESLQLWHGVLFLRRSLYADGVFKFRIELPAEYPETTLLPKVYFETQHVPLFNPLIQAQSGQLDLSIQFQSWDNRKMKVHHVLAYMKKVFYTPSWWAPRPTSPPFNREASQWLERDCLR